MNKLHKLCYLLVVIDVLLYSTIFPLISCLYIDLCHYLRFHDIVFSKDHMWLWANFQSYFLN